MSVRLCAQLLQNRAIAHQHESVRGRAFTIVELLVTVGVVAVLLSLALPAIGTAMRNARLTARLSYHKQFTAAFTMYAMDARGMLPYFSDPLNPESIRWVVDGWEMGEGGAGHFCRVVDFWPTVLVPRYLDWPSVRANGLAYDRLVIWEYGSGDDSRHPLPYARHVGPNLSMAASPFRRSNFRATMTMVGEPAYFAPSESAPRDRTRLLRAQRLADVLYPSAKGMLRDTAIAPGALGPGIAQRIDGELVDLGRLSAGLFDGSAGFYPDRLLTVDGIARCIVLWTPNGIRGREF